MGKSSAVEYGRHVNFGDEQHSAEPVFRLRLHAAGIPIAAGVLYPTFGLLLSPERHSALHVGKNLSRSGIKLVN
jgi:hypothetical protein